MTPTEAATIRKSQATWTITASYGRSYLVRNAGQPASAGIARTDEDRPKER